VEAFVAITGRRLRPFTLNRDAVSASRSQDAIVKQSIPVPIFADWDDANHASPLYGKSIRGERWESDARHHPKRKNIGGAFTVRLLTRGRNCTEKIYGIISLPGGVVAS